MNQYQFGKFTRISKAKAKKLFLEGKNICLCPVKLRPGFPFAPQCTIFGDRLAERLEDAERTKRHSGDIFTGSVEETAWQVMYNQWAFHNTSYEAGYYAAYYVEAE